MATAEPVKAGTESWFLSSRDLRADRWEFLFTRVVGGVLETHEQSVPVSVPYPEAEAAGVRVYDANIGTLSQFAL